MKTGIFVGSFNPPTKAHFEIVNLLYKEKLVERIVFVPSNNDKKNLISLDRRIDMLNEYCNDYSYLEVSDVMRNYLGNFNYQVLDELAKKYNNLYIIMGSDLLNNFYQFDNYLSMLDNYYFIIIPRENIDIKSLIDDHYKDYKEKFIILDYHSNISSSLVRKKLREKNKINELVDKKILNYIQKEKIYQDE